MRPYYEDDAVTLYHGDCREILPDIEADVLVSDPPYPNRAGHFNVAVGAARDVLSAWRRPALVFWDEMEIPPVPLPLVARHVWHRTNTNRPDNYEAIYEFADGPRRASRVFPFAVVYPGLTGCYEATGHPTQKSLKLMQRLVECRPGVVVDPFAGSGSTLEAAKRLGRRAVGIETDERYCEIAARRLAQGVLDLEGAAVPHSPTLRP